MDLRDIEYVLVLAGCVIALVLGCVLLAIKTPQHEHRSYYVKGKNICALAFLLFGGELLFQWIIRFILVLGDHVLSVSVYLFTCCTASLLFATGIGTILAPAVMTRRQHLIALSTLVVYVVLLTVNYTLVPSKLQNADIDVACLLLFLLNCVAIYKILVFYRSAINDLRTYYADVLDNLMRWLPGVGFSIMLFLISAPITCLCPKIVGTYQLALGILVIIYTFVSIVNFSFKYGAVATALNTGSRESTDVQAAASVASSDGAHHSSLSTSLQEVMQDKERRWREQGLYHASGVTIDQAAHEMGTNRSYLSRYLNEVRHMTFYEWVAQMRIAEAQQLMLRDPDSSIEQIARQVGFAAPSTFSTTFKKIVGSTPNQWRKRH